MFLFWSNHINTIINMHQLVKSKQIKYGSLISNTNRSDQPDTHWWNITDNRHHSLRPYWVGREVKIKSIHNDDFSKMCVGSLIKKKMRCNGFNDIAQSQGYFYLRDTNFLFCVKISNDCKNESVIQSRLI